MSDTGLGDSFQRSRGAVLNAVLSDPGLGRQGEMRNEESNVVEPALGGTEGSAVETAPPSPDRRRGGGSRASEQILALLNGGEPETAAGVEFSPDYSDLTSARLNAESGEDPPSASKPSSASAHTQRDPSVVEALAWLKRPKIALAIGGVLVVVLVAVLIATRGNSQPGQTAIVTVTNPPAAAPSAPVTPEPGAVIQVKSAASHCPPGSTAGLDAFGGQGKAWSCVRAYKVDGQILTIDLGKAYQIDSIGIVPGWDSIGSDGVDEWTKYRTASRVSYRFDDPNAPTYTQPTLDQRTLVVTRISPPVTASHIVLTVLESKGDSSLNTVAVSSIVITGH
ncbi:MAG: type protein [Nocardia sp.]|uniref:hypothetical protein n=1 Tax=Nocardia sp. TaxID=1821 RepID=UPI002617E7F3|nr:hypothetical protein [Nocardia sp.]MCU1645969.1 type protein [Nocardia sp.]